MTETYIIKKSDLHRLSGNQEIFEELTDHIEKRKKRPLFPDVFKVSINSNCDDEEETEIKFFTMENKEFLEMVRGDNAIYTVICLFRSIGKKVE